MPIPVEILNGGFTNTQNIILPTTPGINPIIYLVLSLPIIFLIIWLMRLFKNETFKMHS